MDIITMQDQAISTDIPPRGKNRDAMDFEHLKRSTSINRAGEKKKSESKKLKKKLVMIEEQNESLSKLIYEKNTEIVELRKSVNSLNEVLNSVPLDELKSNSSIASSKLLELSKKNRQLRAELETTKNRLNRKELQIQKLEKDLKLFEENSHQDIVEKDKKESSSPSNELQSKLTAMQQKLFETRNKNIELSNQLKLAQKCLQQEIGEHFNLNLLASHASTSSWRGRAQKIIHLQQKIQELKDRLDNYEQQSLNFQVHSINTSGPSISNDHILNRGGSVHSFERPNVRRSELEHRIKVENLEKDIAMLRTHLDESQSKILALKVRNKTLNDEISRYKAKAENMVEKNEFENFNVAVMNDKLNQQKLHYETRINEMTRDMNELKKENEELELKEERLRDKVEEAETVIAGKDDVIAELNTVIKKLEDDLKAICGDFLFSCREFRKEEFITILDSLEAEKNALVELTKTLNDRVEQERLKNNALQEQTSKQKIRISRLEAKVREMERDIETNNEKKKRSQRIAEYASSLSGVGSNASVMSFTFENSSQYNNSLLGVCNLESNDGDCTNVTELKNRLELATEKITILQEKLDYIAAEKENDLKAFQNTVSNTKNFILETIMTQRANKSDLEIL
ncbi:uncharacterized protein LOC142236359 [Haematobia irritans]|uniref:uncharacterized protein LOC142236359 n=1 Tax=Haematobia irritans TaxID=7368 RepID=UPI003F504C9C